MKIEEFLLSVLASLIASFMFVLVITRTSPRIKQAIISGLAKYLGYDLDAIFETQGLSEQEYFADIRKSQRVWILSSRGNEFKSSEFRKFFQQHGPKVFDLRVLLPDTQLHFPEPDWVKQRDKEISAFDAIYGKGYLKKEVKENIDFLAMTLAHSGGELRLFSHPHLAKITITDNNLYFRPYTSVTHGSHNFIYRFKRGEMYSTYERLFTMFWDEARSANPKRSNLVVYLAGSIQKPSASVTSWDSVRQHQLQAKLNSRIQVINPADFEGSYLKGTYMSDLEKIEESDIVVVDALERRGIGVGIEMAYAKMRGKIVIAIVGTNSYYSTPTGLHSFVQGLADFCVLDIESAAQTILGFQAIEAGGEAGLTPRSTGPAQEAAQAG